MWRRRNSQAIEAVLHSLGLFGTSTAMLQMLCAIRLAHADVYLVKDMMSRLYPAVARHFEGASVSSVERNLRSIRDKQWAKGDVDLLRKMAGFNLQEKPTTGEFIDIIRYYMEREGLFDQIMF